MKYNILEGEGTYELQSRYFDTIYKAEKFVENNMKNINENVEICILTNKKNTDDYDIEYLETFVNNKYWEEDQTMINKIFNKK